MRVNELQEIKKTISTTTKTSEVAFSEVNQHHLFLGMVGNIIHKSIYADIQKYYVHICGCAYYN